MPSGRTRVRGIGIVHHLDRPAVPEPGQVGDQLGLAVLASPSHDHHDLVARVEHVDQLADRPALAGASHPRERLPAVLAREIGARVARVPFHLRIEELADGVEVAAPDRFVAATRQIDEVLAHGPSRATTAVTSS
jgi:hypothetical protein